MRMIPNELLNIRVPRKCVELLGGRRRKNLLLLSASLDCLPPRFLVSVFFGRDGLSSYPVGLTSLLELIRPQTVLPHHLLVLFLEQDGLVEVIRVRVVAAVVVLTWSHVLAVSLLYVVQGRLKSDGHCSLARIVGIRCRLAWHLPTRRASFSSWRVVATLSKWHFFGFPWVDVVDSLGLRLLLGGLLASCSSE